jgi:hypothetical protein
MTEPEALRAALVLAARTGVVVGIPYSRDDREDVEGIVVARIRAVDGDDVRLDVLAVISGASPRTSPTCVLPLSRVRGVQALNSEMPS